MYVWKGNTVLGRVVTGSAILKIVRHVGRGNVACPGQLQDKGCRAGCSMLLNGFMSFPIYNKENGELKWH